MYIVLGSFVDDPSTTSTIEGQQVPATALIEVHATGRRWMLADIPPSSKDWVEAQGLGALGMVRTVPTLSYVSKETAKESGTITSGRISVPDHLWIRCEVLPLDPFIVTERTHAGGFVHIHNHSEFSPLDGLTTVSEMVAVATAQDCEAVGVTDHGYCAAHPHLQKAARAAGVKPLFGVEANLVPNRFEHVYEEREGRRPRPFYWHFLLMARNEVGLKNLWAASSEAHIEGFWHRPRMDWSTLERHSEGLIASTACLRGPLTDLILKGDIDGARTMIAQMRAIFPESLYLEIHTNHLPDQVIVNTTLAALGAEMGIPLLAVCDAHYAEECDDHLHKVWIAVQTDKDLTEDQELFSGGERYFMKTETEVRQALDYLPQNVVDEAVQSTLDIARTCDVSIKQGSAKPVYHRMTAPGFDSALSGAERDYEKVRELCEARFDAFGLAEKDVKLLAMRSEGAKVETYRERLEREITMLRSKGFCGYFLVVWDYVDAAKSGRTKANKRILMGPGRGSVVGCLVAYLMGITAVDPIEADLLFERFITVGRESPPDIDLDFPSSERDSVTDYITDRWNADRVVRVGTVGRLQNKGVLRSLEKVLRTANDGRDAIDFKDLIDLTKIIEAAEAHTAGAGLKWAELWEQEGELLEPYRVKYPVAFALAEQLVKRVKSYGRHASGVVIDPENPIIDRLPLRVAGKDEDRQVVTEFDMEALELLGYLKFDILTLRTLDTIQVCLDMIRDDPFYGGMEIDIDSWRAEYEDPQVWDMLCEGDTLGVFQIETSAGTRLVKQMQPQSIADLSAILTLVRPGPKRSGLTDTYIARRFGQQETVPLHPKLEPVLGRTYQCFGGETEIVTFDGVKRIADLSGDTHRLMSRTGGWVDAEVRSFGVQSLRKITLRRNKQEKVVWATGDHRWFAKWAGRQGKNFSEVITDGLKPGMTLPSAIRSKARTGTNISPVGICAGIVFGDGSSTPCSSYVDLWGQKNLDLLRYFGEQRRSDITTDDPRCALPMVRVFDMPRSWKRLPSLDEGASYLLGWMAGYFAADGHVDKSGCLVISSACRDHLEHYRTVANIVGIGTYAITCSERPAHIMPQGSMGKAQTQFLLGLVPSTIPDGFLLVGEHRSRHEASMGARSKADRTQWSVVSVEVTDRVDDVYCAVVPGDHAFVLDGHIVTGNCMIYQEDIMAVCSALAGYDLEESDKVRAILGKKKVEEAAKEGARFISRAIANGVEQDIAERIWAQMEEFAKYCVTGDTRIMLAGAGRNSDGWMPVEDAYRRLHVDPPSHWRAKFRAKSKGVFGMAVHPDGRIRKCRILNVRPAGQQPVVKITLANGMSITATPDHRHLTPDGLRCVDDGLAVGDLLIVNGGYERDGYVPDRDRTTVGDRAAAGSVNTAFGDDNYGYINGGFANLSAWTAQTPKVCQECGHDGSDRRIERAHLDGNRQNNDWSNLRMLCVSCHRRHDYAHNGRRRRGEKGLLSAESAIVSITDEGVQETYDVMMDEPHVWIANGIATTNTFNRAHAWSYAVLAYWCAWLKCHFPAHFSVAVLSTIDKKRIPEFVEMSRRSGYKVLPPDVNTSVHGFSVAPDRLSIRYGFGSINSIGQSASDAIIQGQPYADWNDFLDRRGKGCNYGHIKTLAALGVFDTLIPEGFTRPSLEAVIEQLALGKSEVCAWKDEGVSIGEGCLPCTFDWTSEVNLGPSGKPRKPKPLPKKCTKGCRNYTEREGGIPWPTLPALSDKEVRERERATLGVYLSSSPFDVAPLDYLDAEGFKYGPAVDTLQPGNHGVFAIVQRMRKHIDSAGREMAFVTLNSMGHELEVTVFSSVYQGVAQVLKPDLLGFFDINCNERGQTLNVVYPIPV